MAAEGAERVVNAPGVVWDAAAYGRNLAHHRAYDAALLDSLQLAGDEQVLDLGCGVGDLARTLARALPQGAVTAVDADPDMVRQAAASAPANMTVEQVRAQDVAERFGDAAFDVVVSVAVLHWVPAVDQSGVAASVHRVLRAGGRFRADFGGRGQIAVAKALLDDLAVRHGGSPADWYFPSAEDHRRLLESAGFDTAPPHFVRLLHQRRPFDEEGVRGWLASQVTVAYLPGVPEHERAAFRAGVEPDVLARLRRADGSYDQDYVRVDVSVSAGKAR